MKKEITVSAKSVDEAIAKAVAELGAPSAEKIEYTVIEEAKKGFLGIGASDAKIVATYVLGGPGSQKGTAHDQRGTGRPGGHQHHLLRQSGVRQ